MLEKGRERLEEVIRREKANSGDTEKNKNQDGQCTGKTTTIL